MCVNTLIARCLAVCGHWVHAQDWGAELFEALKQAGGRGYSNYAVGYNNVQVPEATKRGIPVGNTPGGCDWYCVDGCCVQPLRSGHAAGGVGGCWGRGRAWGWRSPVSNTPGVCEAS